MGDERHAVLHCPYLQSIKDTYARLFSLPSIVQFLWQDDLETVTNFLCERMSVMFLADSANQSQTHDEP